MKKPKTKKAEKLHLRGVVATIEGPGVSGFFAHFESNDPDAAFAALRGLLEQPSPGPTPPKLPTGKGPR